MSNTRHKSKRHLKTCRRNVLSSSKELKEHISFLVDLQENRSRGVVRAPKKGAKYHQEVGLRVEAAIHLVFASFTQLRT